MVDYKTEVKNKDIIVDTNQKKIIKETDSGFVAVGHDYKHSDSKIVQVASALSKGEMPSNVEIESTLEIAKESLEENERSLSYQGKKLSHDAQDIIESTQQLLEHKNRDENLQKIVKEANLLGRDTSQTAGVAAQRMEQQLANQPSLIQERDVELAKETMNNIRDVVFFMIRSSDFRGFLFDLMDLFQSMLRDIDEKHGDELNKSIKKDVNRGDSKMPQTQSTAQDLVNDLQEGNIGDENKKRSLEDRLENMLTLLSNNPQYNRALDNIYTLVSHLSARFAQMKNLSQLESYQNQLDPNDRTQVIINESYDLLIQFVNENDLTKLQNEFWSLYYDLQNDNDATSFLYDLRMYLKKQLESPDQITDESRKREAKDFVERAQRLFRLEQNKYQSRFDFLFRGFGDLLNQIRYDDDTQKLSSAVNQFAKDFIMDEQGRPDLFVAQESIGQLRDMLIPMIEKELQTLPLPMIEGSTPKYDYRLDNMTLNGTDIIPDRFDLRFVSDVELGHNHHKDSMITKLKMSADNIRLAINDINFWYHRNAIPRMTDEGVADVKVLGKGLSFKIEWKMTLKENRPLFLELHTVKCNIDKLDITIKKSNHSIINKLAVKLFGGTIKQRMADTIVEKMKEVLEPMNDSLNDFFRQQRDLHLTERANVKLKEAFESKEKPAPIKEKEFKREYSPPSTQYSSVPTTDYTVGQYVNIRKDVPVSSFTKVVDQVPTSATTVSQTKIEESKTVQKKKENVYDSVWRKYPKESFAANNNPFAKNEDIVDPSQPLE